MSNSGTLASNKQNTTSPKHNDDVSPLISQYLISGFSIFVAVLVTELFKEN
jgi:hypothetical protein